VLNLFAIRGLIAARNEIEDQAWWISSLSVCATCAPTLTPMRS